MLLALALLAPPVSQPPLAPLTSTDSYPTGKGTVGVSFVLPGGSSPKIGADYFINNDVAVVAGLRLDAIFSPSGTPAGFEVDVGLRLYQTKHDRVGIFLQPEIDFGRDEGSAT